MTPPANEFPNLRRHQRKLGDLSVSVSISASVNSTKRVARSLLLPRSMVKADSTIPCVIPLQPESDTRKVPHASLGKLQLLHQRHAIQLRHGMIIGRSSDADAQILHETISRKHAMVIRDYMGRVCLVDLASGRGTFLNDSRRSLLVLSNGDTVRLGSVVCIYEAKCLPTVPSV